MTQHKPICLSSVNSRARFPLQSMASELDTFNLSNCKVRHFGIRNCWTQFHHPNILTDSLYLSPSRSSLSSSSKAEARFIKVFIKVSEVVILEIFYEGGGGGVGGGGKVSPFLAHSMFLDVNGMINEFE